MLLGWSCQSERRLRIIAGTIDYVTYLPINESEIEVDYFDRNDSIFGICIQFDIESYEVDKINEGRYYHGPDENDRITLISGHTEKGGKFRDSIDLSVFRNDSLLNSMILPSGLIRPTRSIGSSEEERLSHSTVYDDLIDFKNTFNDSTSDLFAYSDPVSEFKTPLFFWTTDKSLIEKIISDEELVLSLKFNSGKTILIK